MVLQIDFQIPLGVQVAATGMKEVLVEMRPGRDTQHECPKVPKYSLGREWVLRRCFWGSQMFFYLGTWKLRPGILDFGPQSRAL